MHTNYYTSMSKHFVFSLLTVGLVTHFLYAAKVDTLETFSTAMNKKIKVVVITPDAYAAGKEFPVVYLLHGYSGNYADWIKKAPAIQTYADQYNLIVVCPDGGYGSWYYDSPVDPSWKYETYVADELVPWIDKNYRTTKRKEGRAITGLSMGGHGALYLAFKHPNFFGAAGSMSGGVDIRPFPNNWNISARLGTYAKHPDHWNQHTVINMLHLVSPGSLALIIDCGTSDFFYGVNQKLHQKMLENNIAHDYITRPGGHTWEYWANAIEYQLVFMNRFFRNGK